MPNFPGLDRYTTAVIKVDRRGAQHVEKPDRNSDLQIEQDQRCIGKRSRSPWKRMSST